MLDTDREGQRQLPGGHDYSLDTERVFQLMTQAGVDGFPEQREQLMSPEKFLVWLGSQRCKPCAKQYDDGFKKGGGRLVHGAGASQQPCLVSGCDASRGFHDER